MIRFLVVIIALIVANDYYNGRQFTFLWGRGHATRTVVGGTAPAAPKQHYYSAQPMTVRAATAPARSGPRVTYAQGYGQASGGSNGGRVRIEDVPSAPVAPPVSSISTEGPPPPPVRAAAPQVAPVEAQRPAAQAATVIVTERDTSAHAGMPTVEGYQGGGYAGPVYYGRAPSAGITQTYPNRGGFGQPGLSTRTGVTTNGLITHPGLGPDAPSRKIPLSKP